MRERTPRNNYDAVLLVGVALLLCIVGVGSFVMADIYHFNAIWLFFGWNSIALIPIFARKFRGHWKNPFFILFFAAWMVAHGGLIIFLMSHGVPYGYWPVLMLIEFMIALGLAHWLFSIPYERDKSPDQAT